MSTEIISKPYRVPSGEGLTNFWWKTGRMTVKAGRTETGGAFAQLENFDPRGTATPLHVHHNEDETFYVVEGEVTVIVGGERIEVVGRERLPLRPARRPAVRRRHLGGRPRDHDCQTRRPQGALRGARHAGQQSGGERPTEAVLPADARGRPPLRSVRLRDPGPPVSLEDLD